MKLTRTASRVAGAARLLLLSLPLAAMAQGPGYSENDQSLVVAALAREIADNYVLPDVGVQLAERLVREAGQGRYRPPRPPDAFAEALTDDLRAWSEDEHFFVYWAGRPPDGPPPGFGQPFARVERHGGIAILRDIRKFSGKDSAAATMAQLGGAGTDALVFDLRGCTGGEKITVGHVAGYLFQRPVHLATLHERGARPVEARSARKVKGKRLPDAAVYIVTSGETASGCEAFAYYLKHAGRATIVGETTLGAAHSVRTFDLAARYRAFIPKERPVSPITGGNWQGTGVVPHVETPAADALDEALRMAREPGR